MVADEVGESGRVEPAREVVCCPRGGAAEWVAFVPRAVNAKRRGVGEVGGGVGGGGRFGEVGGIPVRQRRAGGIGGIGGIGDDGRVSCGDVGGRQDVGGGGRVSDVGGGRGCAG